ncbi:phosphodiester glycosidase family protein [Falsibacillus pallidus]|uniref:phosphodiester glycosidase family protein n=1 Tax=Falsibacillus pallidus TaxID=493781 RepID=UPI003D984771
MLSGNKIARLLVIMSALFVIGFIGSSTTSAAEKYMVTPGVTLEEANMTIHSQPQAVKVLDMDLSNPYIKVESGIPVPLTNLQRPSNAAKNNTYDGHHVVGAINASFYHFDSRLPAYLVVQKNRVSTLGVISTGFGEYMSIPSAFGIDKNGKGHIGKFSYDSSFTVNGSPSPITSINKSRGVGETILFTPNYSYSSTRTNSYGMEIVVTGLSQKLDEGIEFGKPITGTVKSVSAYGTGNSVIPDDGYVLSVQGGELAAKYADFKPGQSINLTVNVDDSWKDSQFMLASGPLLVQNGKVNMTIDPNSARARERNPRTAVITNQDGTKVSFVTVDGRQSGYSAGMTLSEFADYLVSIGAYQALNLDGGGSTTMSVRRNGNIFPTMINSPSEGVERSVSAILQAVSTAPIGDPAILDASISGENSILVGSSLTVSPNYILDQYYHRLTADPSKFQYAVEGGVGHMNGNEFIADKAGSGSIVVQYGAAVKRFPVQVIASPARVEVSPVNLTVAPKSTVKFSVKAYDASNRELTVNPNVIQWWATNDIGVMSQDGTFTANDVNKSGVVQATILGVKGQTAVRVVNTALAIDSMENAVLWKAETARAAASISFPGASYPYHDGSTALKLDYDFTQGAAGIAAAYASFNNPVELNGKPNYIGLWVYGDGQNHWLRGKLLDGKGQEVTIDFTEEGGLNWTGWKYVKAAVPSTITLPIKFSKIYVAEATASKQGRGTLYFDKLQAEYGTSYMEPIFTDVPNDHWAQVEINYLTNKNVINGYQNGSFLPENSLTRAHAAALLARALNLDTKNVNDPHYQDLGANDLYYNEIAAVTKAGIMNGKNNGTEFDAEGLLTRAQMAAILARAYDLSGTVSDPFKDVPPSYWAYKEIHALLANGITTGYEADHTFKPNNTVTRAQFSAFLYRIDNRDK